MLTHVAMFFALYVVKDICCDNFAAAYAGKIIGGDSSGALLAVRYICCDSFVAHYAVKYV